MESESRIKRSTLIARIRDERVGNSKLSDEYDMLERKLIHPMTKVSQN